ncbi:LysM peptidoglycan-binding domain-containing protein [Aneurinibacillus aneurinilyticus]|uniref:LysM domain protein n=1 Tax=Aneurinibacillus aneurinilyticus ATCC 12856 TaxID=649747 RepID=U1X7S3_ANEAE|nr:LysM domain-containing protein [Aneurinibacillus aneurinilyticus]ERI11025.1 LysM domain protein [Aneurinibacillus aneurinilyticus ATCC 12856]MED0708761.1 LysM domain-containing protein [Aneurinibacillus aneurinilyticus]MED0722744.1 LysM domain-containing protein [Aneurinibacillus aneurinilyticus]MED0735321.1 LysM domain-containing protein [Aneurinibacillus aneurinilyticus]MED0739667.1 LysM domain-containing protein [Aneurinibacillus aneurinilyticus]
MKKELFTMPVNRSEHSGIVCGITKGEAKMKKRAYGVTKFLIPITISLFAYSAPVLAKESQEMVKAKDLTSDRLQIQVLDNPVHSQTIFSKTMDGSVEVERPSVMTKGIVSYKVQKGDSMSSIAATFEAPLKDLLTANSHIKNYNKLSVGQDVYLP